MTNPFRIYIKNGKNKELQPPSFVYFSNISFAIGQVNQINQDEEFQNQSA